MSLQPLRRLAFRLGGVLAALALAAPGAWG